MSDRDDHGRVSWRSRRGMLELDLYLVPFADREYAGLSAAQRRSYGALLEQADWEILDWLQGRSAPPVRFEDIVDSIRTAAAGDRADRNRAGRGGTPR